jgi:hypothetical protein
MPIVMSVDNRTIHRHEIQYAARSAMEGRRPSSALALSWMINNKSLRSCWLKSGALPPRQAGGGVVGDARVRVNRGWLLVNQRALFVRPASGHAVC